jgi:hypothetical protein
LEIPQPAAIVLHIALPQHYNKRQEADSMKYKLVKIKPLGMRVTLTDDDVKELLISTAKTLKQTYPDERFGVIDGNGLFVWPSKLAHSNLPPAS